MTDQFHDTNEAISKKLHAYHWTNRLLTTAALGIGLLAIAAAVLLVWANSARVFPQVQLLVQQYGTAHTSGANAVASTTATNDLLVLSDGTKVDQQVLVTLMLGKAMNVTSLALTLLGLGTLLTLVLVIFNRRVTLRQINANLAQISQQIKEMQEHGRKSS
jgi:hypothetical protein